MLAFVTVLVATAVTIAAQHTSDRPSGLSGLPLPAGTNVQFLMSQSDGRAAWYSTASLTEAPIAGLSSLGSGGIIAFGRVQGGAWESAGCIRDCSASREYYFIADGSRTATPIGAGIGISGVVASDHAGAVWLTSYPSGSTDVTNPDAALAKAATARLVSTSGQALGPQYQLPPGYWPLTAVGRYLLLMDIGAKPSAPRDHFFVLWDPPARRVVRYIDNAIAASQDRVAWTKGCRGCHVQILNVATGKSTPTTLSAGSSPPWGTGRFSDDGQLLAYKAPVSTSCACQWGGPVDVYNVRTGRMLFAVPEVSPSEWEVAGWLNGGPTLMVAVGPTGGHHGVPQDLDPQVGPSGASAPAGPPTQVGIWQPGDTALRVATVRNTAERYALILSVLDYDDLFGLQEP